jgi:DNA-binding XRE family transcriptional regulator
MTNFPKWQDVRDGIVAGAGGEETVTEARHRNQACIDGHRLAERRKAAGLTQAEVAERMSVTKSRVSQIERGEASQPQIGVPGLGRCWRETCRDGSYSAR